MGLMSLPSCVVGIDISKSFLDCFLHPAGMVRRFGNDSQGHQALIGFVAEYQAFGVLEATGPYDRALCQQLHQAGLAFHRANPRKARQFARAAGFLAKTDRVDARMLALYGATMSLAPEAKPDAARQVLRTLVERRDQLVAMRKSERIRLAQPHCRDIDESLRQMMEVLDRQIAAINVRIDILVTQVEALAEDQAILRSAPGVGLQTASVLLAYMPELGSRDRRSVAALAGLAPIACDSGAMRGKRCIWGGRKRVRDALYMAALAACRSGPFKRIFQAMRNAGKPPKLVLIAIARRLLVALNAAMRDRKPFQA